eukprot:COSAG01_NODE_38389_length_490_cov_0.900256_2_plen_32_part_01
MGTGQLGSDGNRALFYNTNTLDVTAWRLLPQP